MPDAAAAVDPRRIAWRLAVPPLITAKAVAVIIPLLTVWFDPGRSGTMLEALRGAFVHWDAIHYLHIASHGYASQLDFHQAFLPGYPLLLAVVSVAVRDQVLAALIIALAAEAILLHYVARLVMAERDVPSARFAVWCVALGPVAFFFSAAYPDVVIAAAMAAALFHSRQGRWVPAAAAAAIAASMRLTGLVLIPVLLLEYVRQVRPPRRPRWDLLAVLAAPLPFLAYVVFCWVHVGDPLAFIQAQKLPEFNMSAATPWHGFDVTWRTVVASDGEVQAVFIREIGFAWMGLVACLAAWFWPRFPRSFALHCTLVLLLATSLSFWRSVPRYDLALFPVVIMLADLTRGRRTRYLRPVVLAAAGVVMTWGAWTFARGHWLG